MAPRATALVNLNRSIDLVDLLLISAACPAKAQATSASNYASAL
jgi:hypothetical protein